MLGYQRNKNLEPKLGFRIPRNEFNKSQPNFLCQYLLDFHVVGWNVKNLHVSQKHVFHTQVNTSDALSKFQQRQQKARISCLSQHLAESYRCTEIGSQTEKERGT